MDLNTPQHDWYQRRYHVRLPRMAESRTYLDPKYFGFSSPPAVVPAGWAFGMRVGISTTDFPGFQHPERTIAWGGFTPEKFMGYTVAYHIVTTGNNVQIAIATPGVQIPGINNIQVTTQGFAGGPITLPWVVGNLRYMLAGQTAYRTYLLEQLGNTLGVNLVAS
jgi:hypothetical protein